MQQQNDITLTSWGNVYLWNLKDALRTLKKEFPFTYIRRTRTNVSIKKLVCNKEFQMDF